MSFFWIDNDDGDISNSVMTKRALQEQADQTSKALGLRIIRILGETFAVNENQVFLAFGAVGVNP